MKKMMLHTYGADDVMKIEEHEIPQPHDTGVVKTVAIGVNDPDIIMRKNGPFPTMPEHMKPTLPHSLGQDFSGIVTAVGKDVTRFKVGDHVVGMAFMRTYSEYILLDEREVFVKVPDNLDLIPLGGFYLGVATAYAATIRDGKASAGQKVLIHGGAGGVGSKAIQLAKNAGAYVIATGRASQADYMKSLGADETIDFETQDFTKVVSDLDLVVNITGQATLDKSYQVVKKGGRITSVNGLPNKELAKEHGVEIAYSHGFMTVEELENVVKLYEEGKLDITIDKEYPFNEDGLKQAHYDFEFGHNKGKKVIVF